MEFRVTAYECELCELIFSVDVDALSSDYPKVTEIACPKCTRSDKVRCVGDGEMDIAEL